MAAAVAFVALGCEEPPAGSTPSADAAVVSDPDETEAIRLAAHGAPLPVRAEVVALADRLAVRATRSAASAERPRLSWLAARLRDRLWRFDQRATDAGEALELYRSVVEQAAGAALGCDADRSRALLAGDIARDARVLFLELHIALARQDAVLGATDDPLAKRCLEELRQPLRLLSGLRPTGEAWTRLERDAESAALALRARIPARAEDGGASRTSVDGGTMGPAAAGSGSASSPSANPTRVIVSPDARHIGDGPVELKRIQPFSWEHGGRVVITLSAPASYTVGTLDPEPGAGRGHRVYLDVARARVRGVGPEIPAKGLVERIRVGKQSTGTRVVLDLTEPATQKVFYLPEPFRIVVDLGTRAAPPAQAATPTTARAVRRITLDPGHGGDDHGAVGPTGLREKDVTLDVAHRAAPALAHELGIETMLTRDTDGHVFLEERIARANAFHADLFVSLHCNATEDGQATGLQLFVLDPSREVDAVSQRVARRENALLGAGRNVDPAALDDHVAAVAAGLNVKALTERSNLLAELLRKATLASTAQRYAGMKDYGIKTAGFFVLMGAEMPAVLMEAAFISNPDDEARLATADFRQKLADSVVNAVRAYRDGR